jgi:hypothetical protein
MHRLWARSMHGPIRRMRGRGMPCATRIAATLASRATKFLLIEARADAQHHSFFGPAVAPREAERDQLLDVVRSTGSASLRPGRMTRLIVELAGESLLSTDLRGLHTKHRRLAAKDEGTKGNPGYRGLRGY